MKNPIAVIATTKGAQSLPAPDTWCDFQTKALERWGGLLGELEIDLVLEELNVVCHRDSAVPKGV